jgi:hypothetical protein
VILKLSDAVISHFMHHKGDNQWNPFGAKVILISVADAQSYAQLDVCHNLSYIHIKDDQQSLIHEMYSLMKICRLKCRVVSLLYGSKSTENAI